MPEKRSSENSKSGHVFGQARRQAKMFRVGLYARVSTNEQQTLAMQNRAMREYAARRGWMIALQVREVSSGEARREAREKVLEAAHRRENRLRARGSEEASYRQLRRQRLPAFQKLAEMLLKHLEGILN